MKSPTNLQERSPHYWIAWYAIIAIIVFVVWGVFPDIVEWWSGGRYTNDFTMSAEFGDSFGALNTLFSGLAFAGVVVALLQQGEQLRHQREEIRTTHSEMRMQNRTLRLQRFENTFVQLVNIHLAICASVADSSGRSYLELYGRFRKRYETEVHENRVEDPSAVRSAYENFHNKYGPHLAPFFQSLENLFRFLYDTNAAAESSLDHIATQAHAKMVYATLDLSQGALLFYHVVSTQGRALKSLLDHFDYASHVPASLIADGHKVLYTSEYSNRPVRPAAAQA